MSWLAIFRKILTAVDRHPGMDIEIHDGAM